MMIGPLFFFLSSVMYEYVYRFLFDFLFWVVLLILAGFLDFENRRTQRVDLSVLSVRRVFLYSHVPGSSS